MVGVVGRVWKGAREGRDGKGSSQSWRGFLGSRVVVAVQQGGGWEILALVRWGEVWGEVGGEMERKSVRLLGKGWEREGVFESGGEVYFKGFVVWSFHCWRRVDVGGSVWCVGIVCVDVVNSDCPVSGIGGGKRGVRFIGHQ